MMKASRWVLALPLIVLLFMLCFYGNLEYKKHLPYPTGSMIAEDYQAYIGKEVFIFGDVVEVRGGEAKISAEKLIFSAAPLSVKNGDLVEIVGILGENYVISVKQSLSYDRLSYYLVFIRSIVGAVILIAVFSTSWRFSWRRFRFEEVN